MTQPVKVPFCADAASPLLRRSAKRERAKRARSNAADISRSGAKAVETGLADMMRQTGRPAKAGGMLAETATGAGS